MKNDFLGGSIVGHSTCVNKGTKSADSSVWGLERQVDDFNIILVTDNAF